MSVAGGLLEEEVERLREENLSLKLREKTLFKLIKDLKASAAHCTCAVSAASPPADDAGGGVQDQGSEPATVSAAVAGMPPDEQAAFSWALQHLDRRRTQVLDLSSDIVANMTGQYHELLLQSTEQLQAQLEAIATRYWTHASRAVPAKGASSPSTIAGLTTPSEIGVALGLGTNAQQPPPQQGALVKAQNIRQFTGDDYHRHLRRSLSVHIGAATSFLGKTTLHAAVARTRHAITAEMLNDVVDSAGFRDYLTAFATHSLRVHQRGREGRGLADAREDLAAKEQVTALQHGVMQVAAASEALCAMPDSVTQACGRYLWLALQRAEQDFWARLQHRGASSTEEAMRQMLLRRVTNSLWKELFGATHRNMQHATQATQRVTTDLEKTMLKIVANDAAWSLRVTALERQLRRTQDTVQNLYHRVHAAEQLALQAGQLTPLKPRPPTTEAARDDAGDKGAGAAQVRRGAHAILRTLQSDINAVLDQAASRLDGASPLLQTKDPRCHARSPRCTSNGKGGGDGVVVTREALRRAMTAVYGRFNSRLQKRIPSILNENEGRFRQLYDRLALKYGDAFARAFRRAGGPARSSSRGGSPVRHSTPEGQHSSGPVAQGPRGVA